jgi:hypothetical protein
MAQSGTVVLFLSEKRLFHFAPCFIRPHFPLMQNFSSLASTQTDLDKLSKISGFYDLFFKSKLIFFKKTDFIPKKSDALVGRV